MGNCCMRELSSTELAGDDWGPMATENCATTIERQRLLGEDQEGGFSYNSNIASSGGSGIREVMKIKISRRELDELMARLEIRGLSMEQVLARLVKNSGHANGIGLSMDHHHHHRHWKPALQSIPEVN